MKKSLFIAIISILLISGCGESLKLIESDYQIKVTGTPGVNFKGTYTLPGSSIKPVQVNGTVPAEYKVKGITVICIFNKTVAKGTLKLEILKDKKVIDASETSEPFGIVTIGKLPNQEGIINIIIGRLLDLLKFRNTSN
jgi:hypothetical protein